MYTAGQRVSLTITGPGPSFLPLLRADPAINGVDTQRSKPQFCFKLHTYKRLYDSRPPSATFLQLTAAISRGDVIGCRGYPLRMRRGELSIMAQELTLLSPCMKLIPKIYHGLSNIDKRYRFVDDCD